MDISADVYAELRDRAKLIKPPAFLKPNRYWAAVLYEDVDPATASAQGDFLWIKANARTAIDAIRSEYMKRRPGEYSFQLGSQLLKGDEKMAELNHHHDNTVILVAAKKPEGTTSSHTLPSPSVPSTSGQPMQGPRESSLHGAAAPSATAGSSKASTLARQPSLQTSRAPSMSSPGVPSPRISAQNLTDTSPSLTPPMGCPPPKQTGREFLLPGSSAHSHVLHPSPFHQPRGHPTTDYMAPSRSSTMSTQPSQSYNNDPRIMSTYQAAYGKQHAWLNPDNPNTSVKVEPHLGRGQLPAGRAVNPVVQGQNIGVNPAAPGTAFDSSDLDALEDDWDTSNSENSLEEDRDTSDSEVSLDALPEDDWDRSVSEVPRTSAAPSEPVTQPQNPYIQQLVSETQPETLEKGVKKAIELLEELRSPLIQYKDESQDAQEWLKSVDDLKKAVGRSRTVIGVVGNTGAGKSSVINALLDEERLVPTNCMRACTAVVTELSFNYSENERTRYMADVEFIKPEEWQKELKVLFSDMIDQHSGKVSKESSNPDTEAGVAWAKIKAVYPQKTKEMLAEGSPEMLMNEPEVRKVLGTTKHLEEPDAAGFYKRLQYFVDSQEKLTDPDKKKEKRRMEYWPLIKVVKIYTRSEALSTGAVVVDLPGVHDSNAARAAVADGYMKQCTGLWIVAPITRAVDDKAAKSLLGDSFKRQLKLDGTYDNVTFICSKTDDISIEEAVSSLNLDETAQDQWQRLDDIRREIKDLKAKVKEHRELKAVYKDAIDDCEDKIEVWENLEEDYVSGKTVYAPVDKSNKRKRGSHKPMSQKKRRTTDSDDDFIDDDDDEPEASEASQTSDIEDEPEERQPLSEEEIQSKLQELKSMKRGARSQRDQSEEQIKGLNKEIKALEENGSAIDNEISALCITGRNQYSKGAIQQDFAAGIKELDQETAQEENEDDFDPDEEIRDYDQVAKSLPVFCVSSRAYQKLCGRLKRDKAVAGFTNAQETEMPQLQAHCKKLTESGRAANSRKFLNNLNQLLTSMGLWASNDGHGVKMSTVQQQKEAAFLEQKLAELEKGFTQVVDEIFSEMTETLAENIYEKYEKSIRKASEKAIPTVQTWGRKREEGGMHWMTLRATVRRDGVYAGSVGPRDFNGELAEPLIKEIATGWERAFQRRLPLQTTNFTKKTLAVLKDFHRTVQKRAHDNGVSMAKLNALEQQLQNYEPFLNDQVRAMKEQMTAHQREINREFTPVIAAAMGYAYHAAASELGPGSVARMKQHLFNHASNNRVKMFRDACDAVKEQLDEMCVVTKRQMAERAQGVCRTARRDYTSALGNLGPVEISLSEEEKFVREDVSTILESAEDVFRRVVEGEDEPKDQVEDEPKDQVEDETKDQIEDETKDQVEDKTKDQVKDEDMTIFDDEDKTIRDNENKTILGDGEAVEAPDATEGADKENDKEDSAFENQKHWDEDDTIAGDEKENVREFADKVTLQKTPGTATAEDAVLKPLDDNARPNNSAFFDGFDDY